MNSEHKLFKLVSLKVFILFILIFIINNEYSFSQNPVTETYREQSLVTNNENQSEALRLGNLGHDEGLKGNYEIALDYYNRAIDLWYKSNLISMKANILFNLNRNDEAINFAEKAIKLNPNDYLPYAVKGQAFRSLKRYNESNVEFDKAFEFEKYCILYYYKGENFIDLDDLNSAYNNFQSALRICPDGDFNLFNSFGYLCFKMEKYEESITYEKMALKYDAKFAAGYRRIANSYFYLGKYNDSMYFFNECLKIDPNFDLKDSKYSDLLLILNKK